MTEVKKDPVLAISKLLIRFMQFFSIAGMLALAAGAVSVLVWQETLLGELRPAYPDISGSFPWLISAFLLSMIPLIGLFWLQLSRLRAIVGTVDEGNPFARINGQRMRLIAILIIAQQFAVLLIMPLVAAIQSAAGRFVGQGGDELATMDFDMSLTALLVALLLIILGRVFEQGADMQDELEGTV